MNRLLHLTANLSSTVKLPLHQTKNSRNIVKSCETHGQKPQPSTVARPTSFAMDDPSEANMMPASLDIGSREASFTQADEVGHFWINCSYEEGYDNHYDDTLPEVSDADDENGQAENIDPAGNPDDTQDPSPMYAPNTSQDYGQSTANPNQINEPNEAASGLANNDDCSSTQTCTPQHHGAVADADRSGFVQSTSAIPTSGHSARCRPPNQMRTRNALIPNPMYVSNVHRRETTGVFCTTFAGLYFSTNLQDIEKARFCIGPQQVTTVIGTYNYHPDDFTSCSTSFDEEKYDLSSELTRCHTVLSNYLCLYTNAIHCYCDAYYTIKDVLPLNTNTIKDVLPLNIITIKDVLPPNINTINNVLPLDINTIKDVLPLDINTIKDVLPLDINTINNVLPLDINTINNVLPLDINTINNVLPLDINTINNVLPLDINTIKDVLPLDINTIKDVLPLDINTLKDVLPLDINTIKDVLPLDINTIKDVLPLDINTIKDVLPLDINTLKDVLPLDINTIKDVLPLDINTIKDVLPLDINTIKDVLPLDINTIKDVLPLDINTIKDVLPLDINTIKDVLPFDINTIKDVLPPIVNDVFRHDWT
ncbi:hypothetical protein Bbelb_028460 [Branchiostoma belcheri]|nr:hypothetical protein Bbelb_028460 [Branchiostoma belcheri]